MPAGVGPEICRDQSESDERHDHRGGVMGVMLAARPEQSAGTLSGPSLLVVATLTAATTALGGFLPLG
jgi:hypothetical protein